MAGDSSKEQQTMYKKIMLKTQVSRREKKESLLQVEIESIQWRDHFTKVLDDEAPDEPLAECKYCSKGYR
ncbi:uncharacterized protein G2W53_009470 [Senna tora]|uniref:Uncharacterized protein n=1 Tax=Senna tora TaxID=362788 RepID=A0A835C813_9FABA|nr:uncharacterized protein G2W53_009470 [Senna tora]